MQNPQNCIQLKIDNLITNINTNSSSDYKNEVTVIISYCHCLDLYEFLNIYYSAQKNEILFQLALIYDMIGYSQISLEYIDEALNLISNIPTIILYKSALFASLKQMEDAQKCLLKYKYLIGEDNYQNYIYSSVRVTYFYILDYEENIILREINIIENKYKKYSNVVIYFIKSMILKKLSKKFKESKRSNQLTIESNQYKEKAINIKKTDAEFLFDQNISNENVSKVIMMIYTYFFDYKPKPLMEYKQTFNKNGFGLFFTLIKICKIVKLRIQTKKYRKIYKNKNNNNNLDNILKNIENTQSTNETTDNNIKQCQDSILSLCKSFWLKNYISNKNIKNFSNMNNVKTKNKIIENYYVSQKYYSNFNLKECILRNLEENNKYKEEVLGKDSLMDDELIIYNESLIKSENSELKNYNNDKIINDSIYEYNDNKNNDIDNIIKENIIDESYSIIVNNNEVNNIVEDNNNKANNIQTIQTKNEFDEKLIKVNINNGINEENELNKRIDFKEEVKKIAKEENKIENNNEKIIIRINSPNSLNSNLKKYNSNEIRKSLVSSNTLEKGANINKAKNSCRKSCNNMKRTSLNKNNIYTSTYKTINVRNLMPAKNEHNERKLTTIEIKSPDEKILGSYLLKRMERKFNNSNKKTTLNEKINKTEKNLQNQKKNENKFSTKTLLKQKLNKAKYLKNSNYNNFYNSNTNLTTKKYIKKKLERNKDNILNVPNIDKIFVKSKDSATMNQHDKVQTSLEFCGKKDAKSEKKKFYTYQDSKENFLTINLDKKFRKIKIANSFRSESFENQMQNNSNKLSYNQFKTIQNKNNNYLVGLRHKIKNKNNIQSTIANPKSTFSSYMINNISKKTAINFNELTNTSEINKCKVSKNASTNKLNQNYTNKSSSKNNLKTIWYN